MHLYDPANMSWTDLSVPASGQPPSPRWGHGFAPLNGKVYLFGGCTSPDANGYCAGPNGAIGVLRPKNENELDANRWVDM